MFEYAYARKVQEMYPNEQIVINTAYMKRNDFRSISIQHFKLHPSVVVCREPRATLGLLGFYMRLPIAFGFSFIEWRLLRKRAYGEKSFLQRVARGLYYTHSAYEYYAPVTTHVRHKYVFGFYQNCLTASDMISTLRNELTINDVIPQKCDELLESISKTNSVCVHIRRGDYLDSKWDELHVCDYRYYKTAIDEAQAELLDPVFYIFSTSKEDIEWIKANYRFDAHTVYVDFENEDYVDMHLMMNCKHYIISNSTYSWWAALLSRNVEKQVWMPSVWNKKDTRSASLICHSCHIINCLSYDE